MKSPPILLPLLIALAFWALGLLLALAGCATAVTDMYQRADQHPPKERTVTWCEGAGVGKKCWRVPASEVQRAMDVLSGQQL